MAANLDERVVLDLAVRQAAELLRAPYARVWLLQPGIYDIDAGTDDQPARIAVFEGSARFVGGTVEIAMKAGDTAVISGKETLTAAIEHASPDAFAKWCRSRDYREQRLAAPYYISPQMTGFEELDEYGGWRSSAQYGEVWYPRSVPSGQVSTVTLPSMPISSISTVVRVAVRSTRRCVSLRPGR